MTYCSTYSGGMLARGKVTRAWSWPLASI